MRTMEQNVCEVMGEMRASAAEREQHRSLLGVHGPFRESTERRLDELRCRLDGVDALARRSSCDRCAHVAAAAAAAQSACERQCEDLASKLQHLQERAVTDSSGAATEVRTLASDIEALRRRVSEEARAAVEEMCGDARGLAEKLQEITLSEMRNALADMDRGTQGLAERVAELAVTISGTRGEAVAQAEQLHAGIAAVERVATGAREDAADALRRAQRTEARLAATCITSAQPSYDVADPGGDLATRWASSRGGGAHAGVVDFAPDPQDSSRPSGTGLVTPRSGPGLHAGLVGSGAGAARALRDRSLPSPRPGIVATSS